MLPHYVSAGVAPVRRLLRFGRGGLVDVPSNGSSSLVSVSESCDVESDSSIRRLKPRSEIPDDEDDEDDEDDGPGAAWLSSHGRSNQLRLFSKNKRRPGGNWSAEMTFRSDGTSLRRTWQHKNCSEVWNEQALITFMAVRAAVEATIGYKVLPVRPV